jgi:LPPG:FO 2-phospho-L-lactate transferase
MLESGATLSEVTGEFCTRWGVKHRILPMSNDPSPTLVHTDIGQMAFQDYFVKRKCEPRVSGFHFENVESALPVPGVLDSLASADLVIICPSNPWVSIDPILAVPGIQEAVLSNNGEKQVVAVSPIIAGAALKGPAAKMYAELGIDPSAKSVAQHYGSQKKGGLLTGFVIDNLDKDLEDDIQAIGFSTLVTNSVMKTSKDKVNLAKEVLTFI